MKLFLSIVIFSCYSTIIFGQKDSLQIGDYYLEDQIYLGVNYNLLINQDIKDNDVKFSYGLHAGYLRDIPFNISRNFGIAIGIGYNYELYNESIENIETISDSNFSIHSIEVPFEIRWRTSNARKFDFWRIYTGLKYNYGFRNSYNYTQNNENKNYSNIDLIKKNQLGISLAIGYGAFNFNVYYGLTPIFSEEISSKIRVVKFGLIFYLF